MAPCVHDIWRAVLFSTLDITCQMHGTKRDVRNEPMKYWPNWDQSILKLRPITLTPYRVFPLFGTRFVAYAEGILISFIQPHISLFDIKCSTREIYHTDLYGWNFINMLSVYAQSGTHRRFNWWIIAVWTFCSDVCADHRRPQTLAEICKNMGICCGFRAVAVWGKYPGPSYWDTGSYYM